MIQPYKLLVIDIDGTLLSIDRRISAENREAVAKVRDRGIKVALSTGRVITACRDVLDQLALDSCHISFDGALVSSPSGNSEIYVHPISRKIMGQMVDYAHEHDLDLELYSTTQYYTEKETWSTNAHREFFGVEPSVVDFKRLWKEERIIKGGLVTKTSEEDARAKEFYRRFSDSLHFSWAQTPAYPGVNFINLLAVGVSKGRALEALAAHLGVTLDEVMAIGDGTNDISLLSQAGLGIAMGNASEEVKAAADYITLDVEEHGLAAAIHKFLL